MHSLYPAAMALYGAHRGVERKADAYAAAVLGKAAREDEGIARTFFRREEAAANQVLDRSQHRLDSDASLGIGFLELKPVLTEERPVALALLKRMGSTKQVENARIIAVVADACLGAERPEFGQA